MQDQDCTIFMLIKSTKMYDHKSNETKSNDKNVRCIWYDYKSKALAHEIYDNKVSDIVNQKSKYYL